MSFFVLQNVVYFRVVEYYKDAATQKICHIRLDVAKFSIPFDVELRGKTIRQLYPILQDEQSFCSLFCDIKEYGIATSGPGVAEGQ